MATFTVDMTKCPVIIFDFDGTLADTPKSIIAVATKVLKDYGMPKEKFKDIPGLIGPPFPMAFSTVLGYSKEDAKIITARYRKIYGNLGKEAWPPYPGVPEMLKDLHDAGKCVAAASSKRQMFLQHSLEDWNLNQYFTYIFGQDDTATHPKTQSIQEIIAKTAPEQAMMVGDRKYDVQSANEVGIPTIGVTYGHTAPESELTDAGAYKIAHTINELRALLGI